MNGVVAVRGRSFPERPGQQDCPFYMRTGQCAYAMTCRFNHPPYSKASLATAIDQYGNFPQRPGQPDCQYFIQTGSCRFGATCKFNHPRDKVGSASRPQLNALLLPLRPGELDCGYYMRTGTCGFGPACKFNHPQPQAVLTPRLLPPWQQQQPQPLLPPHPQQPFMPTNQPLLLSVPTRNSNQTPKAVASSSAASSSSSYSAEVALLPERPEQTECQYYMRTGQCKYGASCRFHHPRDRNVASSPSSCPLSPMGLPLRPGTRACVFYLKYGQCKFGATCRFNHPYMAVPYSPVSTPQAAAFPLSQFQNSPQLPPPQRLGAAQAGSNSNSNSSSSSNNNNNNNNNELEKNGVEGGFPPNGIKSSGLAPLSSSSSSAAST